MQVKTYTAGDDTASRLYEDLYSTKYEIGANRKVSHSGATVNLKHSLSRNDKDSNATHSKPFFNYLRKALTSE